MKDIEFIVEHNIALSPKIIELKLHSDEILPPMKAGQFLHLEVKEASMPLRRPFCLYKFDNHSVTLIIAVVGKGTEKIASFKKGEIVKAILPIGNGFTLSSEHKKVALIGGGVGGAPLLAVPTTYADGKEFVAYLGFANKESIVLDKDFKSVVKTIISTDDGSYGEKGFVTDVFVRNLVNFRPDVILTCGSTPMMKAVGKIAYQQKIAAYMSGESRMACGVGACLVCACQIKEKNGEIHNKRACVDGPVFSLEEIIL